MPSLILERLDDFNRRLESIANSERMSPNGQMQAVALLTTLNAGLFRECAKELRRKEAA